MLAGPLNESVAKAQASYPDGSMSQQLLEKCLEAALSRGTDLSIEYKPWLPVDLMQTLLVDVHEAAGCSWLTAIVIACLAIRVVSLPISVAAIRGTREKALLQPKYNELTIKQQQYATAGDQEKSAEVQKQIQEFQTKHGKLFMLKGTWNLMCFQMPLYITAFAAIRGLASHPDVFRGFAMEAPLWLDSLALADPYAILPCMTAAIMLTNIELFGSIDSEIVPQKSSSELSAVSGQNPLMKYQKHIMRGSALMFVPFTWGFPSGVFVFMSTNMLASAVQNRVLKLPFVERALELPPTAEEVAKTAALLRNAGLPALVPLGDTLSKDNRGRRLPGAQETRLLGVPINLVTRSKETNEEPATRRRKDVLEALFAEPSRSDGDSPSNSWQVEKRFSVRRASRHA